MFDEIERNFCQIKKYFVRIYLLIIIQVIPICISIKRVITKSPLWGKRNPSFYKSKLMTILTKFGKFYFI